MPKKATPAEDRHPQALWAPWRMAYIGGSPKDEGCIFCTNPPKTETTRTCCSGAASAASSILNRYPYNNGHLMVVPRALTRPLHPRA